MKLFIGTVSKNTVDAVIEYANEFNVKMGLIPSRRQVDYGGGYVNNWTTKTLSEYVRENTNNVIIERDHGGQDQGESDYLESYMTDAKYFQAIHIDPWKSSQYSLEAADKTVRNILYCEKMKQHPIWYEIGTEESIYRMETDFENWIKYIKDNLSEEVFNKINYIVVQSGTRLLGNTNIGQFDEQRLRKMVEVANDFGLLTKIHNGDYLSMNEIKKHYEMVDAINIAPEFGYLETLTYLEYMHNGQFDRFYKICYESSQWKKWVDENFEPMHYKQKLVEICGHYVFSTSEFQQIKKELEESWNIDNIIKKRLKKQIGYILNV